MAPLLARRIRPAYLIGAGLVVTAAGMAVIARSDPADGPAALIVGFAVTCLGSGPLVALGTNLVMGAVPPEKAGSASGVVQTNSEFGYALGIAVMGSLATLVYRTRFDDAAPSELSATGADAARESLTGAITVAGDLPDPVGTAVLTAARDAFGSGLHTVATITGVVVTGLAVLIVTTLRRIPPLDASDTAGTDGAAATTDDEPAPATEPTTEPRRTS